jgi:hypothetical protein
MLMLLLLLLLLLLPPLLLLPLLLLYALPPRAALSLSGEVSSTVPVVALLYFVEPVRLLRTVLLPELPLTAASFCCCCCCWCCWLRNAQLEKPGATSACSCRAAAK